MKEKILWMILIILTLGGISLIGYQTYNGFRESQSSTDNVTIDQKGEDEDQTKEDKKVYEIKPEIVLLKKIDISKLPDYTSNSFKNYMRGYLEGKNDFGDVGNCIQRIAITKISYINIGGYANSVEDTTGESSNSCGGGALYIWYLMADGLWYTFGFQELPSCDDISKTTIKSEFMAECADQNGNTVPNPNGSIQ